MIKYNIFFLIAFSLTCFAKIDFVSDEITIHLPTHIIASGNTLFNTQDITISAQTFNYDLSTFYGSFFGSVHANYLDSSLKADQLEFNTADEILTGKDNISFTAPNLVAYSDSFYMKENTIVTLNDNVFIERNGGQIKSNELIYNLKTNSVISNERVKLKLMVED